MFWCQWRLIGLTPIGCRLVLKSNPATSSVCRSARVTAWASFGPRIPRQVRACTTASKDIDSKLDYPPLKPELRQFVDWVAHYTLASRGMVLRMALAHGRTLGPRANAWA